MPLTTKKLDALGPGAAKKKHFDGRGLYVLIWPTGALYWRFDYRYGGKRKTLALGTYPDVSLKQARTALEDARHALRNGIDPSAVRKANKRAARLQAGLSFADAAHEWIAGRKAAVSPKTYVNRRKLIDKRLIPAFKDRPIGTITPGDVLTVLREIEGQGKFSLARRVRQVCAQIFRRALVDGRIDRDPTVGLVGALQPYTETSHAAITEPEQIGGLLRAIDGYDGSPIVKAALQLLPLVFVRPGELRKAEWSEIDLEHAIWRIPASRMKQREPHLVPLAPQAVAILESLIPLTSASRYVFSSVRRMTRPMSDGTLNAALRALGYEGHTMTAHGFRAMARTRIDESLRVPPEVIEIQLAHAMPGALGAVYARAKHLEQRTEMMIRWADYLDGLRAKR